VGVLIASILVPGLAVRATYLMLNGRPAEGSVDFVLAGAAAVSVYISLTMNPIAR
jgi:hypothetical protein